MPTSNIPADLALKLSVLLASLTAITAEDIAVIRQHETLGPDIAANITSLQDATIALDAETTALLNQARTDAGLPPVGA